MAAQYVQNFNMAILKQKYLFHSLLLLLFKEISLIIHINEWLNCFLGSNSVADNSDCKSRRWYQSCKLLVVGLLLHVAKIKTLYTRIAFESLLHEFMNLFLFYIATCGTFHWNYKWYVSIMKLIKIIIT